MVCVTFCGASEPDAQIIGNMSVPLERLCQEEVGLESVSKGFIF